MKCKIKICHMSWVVSIKYKYLANRYIEEWNVKFVKNIAWKKKKNKYKYKIWMGKEKKLHKKIWNVK